MKIRQVEKKDFEELFSLVLAVYDEVPESLNFKSRPDAQLFNLVFANKLSAVAADASVDLVAEDKGSIEGNCEIIKTGNDSGILGILVKKTHRRSGIGSAMLEKACADAASIGIHKITAEVSPRNQTAARFLEGNGWKTKRPGLKGSHCDCQERLHMFTSSAEI